jgi:hypothetical protein
MLHNLTSLLFRRGTVVLLGRRMEGKTRNRVKEGWLRRNANII